jgi:hypothetical protein
VLAAIGRKEQALMQVAAFVT